MLSIFLCIRLLVLRLLVFFIPLSFIPGNCWQHRISHQTKLPVLLASFRQLHSFCGFVLFSFNLAGVGWDGLN